MDWNWLVTYILSIGTIPTFSLSFTAVLPSQNWSCWEDWSKLLFFCFLNSVLISCLSASHRLRFRFDFVFDAASPKSTPMAKPCFYKHDQRSQLSQTKIYNFASAKWQLFRGPLKNILRKRVVKHFQLTEINTNLKDGNNRYIRIVIYFEYITDLQQTVIASRRGLTDLDEKYSFCGRKLVMFSPNDQTLKMRLKSLWEYLGKSEVL